MNKKGLLLFSLCLLASALSAQVWFQVGDRWAYYTTTGWNGGNWGIHTLTVVGDTLVGNNRWKQIRYEQINMPVTYFFARAEGERVYHLHFPFDGPPQVAKIYDFSLLPGDTLRLNANQWYAVVDTTRVPVGSQQRRAQRIRFKGEGDTFLVVEGIGMVGLAAAPNNPNVCSFLLVDTAFCMEFVDGYSYYFRCFRSAQGDQYGFFPEVCKTLQAREAPEQRVEVWPNPASAGFWVHSEYPRVRLLDAQGRNVWEGEVAEGLPTWVPVGSLPRGVYLLHAFSDTGGGVGRRVLLAP